MSRQPLAPPSRVLILGAGAFGASTALSLVEGAFAGHGHLITVLDRSASPPSLDAASSDYNKIVRQDYSDPLYGQLACAAITRWRSPDYVAHRNFKECGVVVTASASDPQSKYVKDSYEVNLRPDMLTPGKRVHALANGEEIRRKILCEAQLGALDGNTSYFNEAGGWADSRQAVVDVIDKARSLGVQFIAGEASQFIYQGEGANRDVKGVETLDGRIFRADTVVVAAGAWSSALLPESHQQLFPTGQTVGTIQLSPEEAERYRNIPITLFLDTGFYCFPPTATGLVKFAIHDRGWVDPQQAAGFPTGPRTTLSPGCENQQIPASAEAALRAGLERVYPELSKKPWCGSRLCWYTDRPSGDWLIDWHPKYRSLFVASGGSGHAFKFFPILGDLVVAGLNGSLSAEQKSYWCYLGDPSRLDKSRGEKEIVRQVLAPVAVPHAPSRQHGVECTPTDAVQASEALKGVKARL